MESLYNIFRQEGVLNIFCDASLRHRGNKTDICYGAIAVHVDDIIDSYCRINSDCTSNFGEAKAMNAALYLAAKYRNTFPVINIFSDSMITVKTLSEYFLNWSCKNGVIYNRENNLVSNQSPYIESIKIIIDNNLRVGIFHVKGHVELTNFSQIKNATSVFSKINNIHRNIDYGFIRYICSYNNIIDNLTRSMIQRVDINSFNVVCPFKNMMSNNVLTKYMIGVETHEYNDRTIVYKENLL